MATLKRRCERLVLRHSPVFQPEDWLEFVETPGFRNAWTALDLTDDDLRMLQISIMARPSDPGSIIQGTGGVRKLRFAPARWHTGKRGAARICYVYFEECGVLVLLFVYRKNVQEDLSADERRVLRTLVAEIKVELDADRRSRKE